MAANDHELITLTAAIVSAHVSRNTVGVSDLPVLIGNVYTSLAKAGAPPKNTAEPEQEPAVSIRASIKPGYLVCLEDGKHYQTLKRHLLSEHNLTPGQYRTKWGLPADYPMTASDYTKTRSALALRVGLGKAKQQPPAEAVPEVAPAAVDPQPDTPAAEPAVPAPQAKRPRRKIAVPKD